MKRNLLCRLCVLHCALLLLFAGGCKSTESTGPIRSVLSPSETPSLLSDALPTPTPAPTPIPTPTPEPTPTPVPYISAVTTSAVKAYSPAGEEQKAAAGEEVLADLQAEPLAEFSAGQLLEVFDTEDPLWYSCTLEDGSAALVYGECLCREGSSKTLVGEYLENSFSLLEKAFPTGKYWNHIGTDIPYGQESPQYVTDTPCQHTIMGNFYCNFYSGRTADYFSYGDLNECLGFASYISDTLFGTDAPFHQFWDLSLLRPGDHVRLQEYEHSFIILTVDEEGITLGEVNENYEDCLITWGREMTNAQLEALSFDITCYSRYPLCPDGQGGFIPWD